MKNTLLFLWLVSCCIACGDKKTQTSNEPTELQTHAVKTEASMEQQDPVLLGRKKRSDLEAAPHAVWFTANYGSYTPDPEVVQQLKPLLKNVNITVFMGTWCGDSKQQTPAFYKILDAAGYNGNNLSLITVSRAKDTPEKYEEGLDIIKVPTFIFYKDGKELNRIVEYPIETLEEDMLAIVSGKPYKHAYAE